SNKDGWFLGFSSGITTGVWMGRDDAKAVPGLQGGTAPARAFASYMRVAVAKRPVEPFDTAVQLPDWQLEPDAEQLYADPNDPYYYTDEQGNLVEPTAPQDRGAPLPPDAQDAPLDRSERTEPRAPAPPAAAGDEFLNQATGRTAVPPAPPGPRPALPQPRPTAGVPPRLPQTYGQ
ncbi:MAG: penicillin-binding protein, partial [Croceibacterium sp.]